MNRNILLYIPLLILSNFLLVRISFSQESKKIIIKHADKFKYNEKVAEGAQRLIGNVKFEHDDVLMTCDSAHYYVKTNSINAYSNVHFYQGDTTNGYSDVMYYDGNSKVAKLRNNVLLEDPEMILTTEFLDYDIKTKKANYFNGGEVFSKKDSNNLTSHKGLYDGKIKMIYFFEDVQLIDPEYLVCSDTMQYKTQSGIAYLFGPSTINSDSNSTQLYTENGYYDTGNDIGILTKKPIFTSEDKILSGDSIYYNKRQSYAEAFSDVIMSDTTEKMDVFCNYAKFYEDKDSAVVTQDAYVRLIGEGKEDTLKKDTLYIHADTLRLWNDSIMDKLWIWAYHKTKFYRNDIQGMCDSLVYNNLDSTIKMFTYPMVWSDKSQLHGDYIEIQFENNEPGIAHIKNNAYVFSQAFEVEDTTHFNQVKGDSMVAYFIKGELDKIYVDGHAQTRFYATEEMEDGSLDKMGFNRATSKNIIVYAVDGDLNHVNFLSKPTAIFYPMDQINKKEMYIDGFIWWDEHRPNKWQDIFNWIEINKKQLVPTNKRRRNKS